MQAKDEVAYEPWCVLRYVGDVLRLLLVARFFSCTTLSALSYIHIRGCVTAIVITRTWITRLQDIVLFKEFVDVPGKDGTLHTTREENLLFPYIGQTLLGRWHLQGSQEPGLVVILQLIESNCQVS